MKTLKHDLLKLNTLLSKNGHQSQVLEQENGLMETDFLHRLKARHGAFIVLPFPLLYGVLL